MKSWIVEDFTPERLQAVADLRLTHYGADDDTTDPAFLEYEYCRNPLGPALAQLAWNREAGIAAGDYALVPIRLRKDRSELNALVSVNVLTHPAHRGEGVYPALSDRAFARAEAGGYHLAYGMPNPNSHPIQMKRGIFQDIGAIPLYLRPLRPSGMVRSYLKSRPLAALARPFNGLFAPRPAASRVEIVRLTTETLALADQFWDAVKDKYPVMVVRDSAYLTYRFLNIPRRQYTCCYALSDGKPVALAIGRTMEVADICCAMIADFLYLDGCETQASALLKHITHILWEQGADMAGCLMLPHTGEARLLKQAGFFPCPRFMEPQPFRLCLRVLRENTAPSDVRNLKNWFFTMGDYDVV